MFSGPVYWRLSDLTTYTMCLIYVTLVVTIPEVRDIGDLSWNVSLQTELSLNIPLQTEIYINSTIFNNKSLLLQIVTWLLHVTNFRNIELTWTYVFKL